MFKSHWPTSHLLVESATTHGRIPNCFRVLSTFSASTSRSRQLPRPSLCSVSKVAKKAPYDIRVFLISTKPRFLIMSENEIKGKGRQVKGKVREEVGKLTNNKTEQVKGKIEQAQGKARENLGKAQRRARKG